eukprot:382058-Prymnesium_polylepis.1
MPADHAGRRVSLSAVILPGHPPPEAHVDSRPPLLLLRQVAHPADGGRGAEADEAHRKLREGREGVEDEPARLRGAARQAAISGGTEPASEVLRGASTRYHRAPVAAGRRVAVAGPTGARGVGARCLRAHELVEQRRKQPLRHAHARRVKEVCRAVQRREPVRHERWRVQERGIHVRRHEERKPRACAPLQLLHVVRDLRRRLEAAPATRKVRADPRPPTSRLGLGDITRADDLKIATAHVQAHQLALLPVAATAGSSAYRRADAAVAAIAVAARIRTRECPLPNRCDESREAGRRRQQRRDRVLVEPREARHRADAPAQRRCAARARVPRREH